MAKILVVEDERILAEMLAALLKTAGHAAVVAPDGESGIRLAVSERPDLILMDMSLPGITGFDAVRRLKADAATRSIPVLALTAHKTSGDKDDAYAAGVDGYETKPIDNDRLLARIAEVLRHP